MTSVGKIGFNGRVGIWFMAIKAIKSHLLLGYGSTFDTDFMKTILYHTNHTHNIVLEFVFETGIVGFVTLIYPNYS